MEDQEALVPLENCIRWLESSLFYDRWLIDPSTVVLLEATVKHLHDYQLVKSGKQLRHEDEKTIEN
jgi:hypothetical protein